MFVPIPQCWVCAGQKLEPYHRLRIDLSIYRSQDPDLARYSNLELSLVRCIDCGFGQPEALPSIENYFDRMYDQHWSEDWISNEFYCGYKDAIFNSVLEHLDRKVPKSPRRLLDLGTHVGRFPFLAHQRGWTCEGIELNPRTRAFASRTTQLQIHHLNAQELVNQGQVFDVVSMIDVLEHIPDPVRMLKLASKLLPDQGIIAVKVPNGAAQHRKEIWHHRVRPSYRPSLADNLVHVNHFTPDSLSKALEKAGFTDIEVTQGVPEETPPVSGVLNTLRNRTRPSFLYYYLLQSLPSAWVKNSYLHLQAYARRRRG